MVTKQEWRDAMSAWSDQMCEDLGGCPTKEECEALYRGELNEDDALRMSARIMFCANAPFPDAAGDDPILTPEQIRADVQKMLSRL